MRRIDVILDVEREINDLSLEQRRAIRQIPVAPPVASHEHACEPNAANSRDTPMGRKRRIICSNDEVIHALP